MRTFSDNRPLTYGMSIFHGHCQKDNHDCDVSLITFPDRTFRMVHHSQPSHVRQFASIYFGRDRFVKFLSVSPLKDGAEHYVEIYTKSGKLNVAWGDGDTLRVAFDSYNIEALPFHEKLKAHIEDNLKSIYYGAQAHKYEDDEVSVIMFAMHLLSIWPEDDVVLSKAEWELCKPRKRTT